MSEKEDITSVSWIFLGMQKIEEKKFFVSREHGYLRICEGERDDAPLGICVPGYGAQSFFRQ